MNVTSGREGESQPWLPVNEDFPFMCRCVVGHKKAHMETEACVMQAEVSCARRTGQVC